MHASPLDSWAAFLTVVSILLGAAWKAIRWGSKVLAELKANTKATTEISRRLEQQSKKLDQHIDEHVRQSLKGGHRARRS